jgi:hypothetical protein
VGARFMRAAIGFGSGMGMRARIHTAPLLPCQSLVLCVRLRSADTKMGVCGIRFPPASPFRVRSPGGGRVTVLRTSPTGHLCPLSSITLSAQH